MLLDHALWPISLTSMVQVALEVPNSAEGAPALRFTGAYDQSGDGCDCIASFDGEQWRLELLSGQCRNLRYLHPARPLLSLCHIL